MRRPVGTGIIGASGHRELDAARFHHVAIDPDAASGTKMDLDDAPAPPMTRRRRHQWRFGHLQTAQSRAALKRPNTRLTVLAKLFAPPEQLAHMKAGDASHLGDSGSGLERN